MEAQGEELRVSWAGSNTSTKRNLQWALEDGTGARLATGDTGRNFNNNWGGDSGGCVGLA